MGFAGISPGSLLLIFFIALLVFGPKRLETLGAELGSALRRFKQNLDGDDRSDDSSNPSQ
ncbi:MAG: twin-arginine translocase TatA/TatE family subunit [Pseudomonadota bacterium]|nr:twin-arginine translocase TatA/TatE family subunit [Pseudomonadota bacterium]